MRCTKKGWVNTLEIHLTWHPSPLQIFISLWLFAGRSPCPGNPIQLFLRHAAFSLAQWRLARPWLPGVAGSFSPCEWRLFMVTDEGRWPPALGHKPEGKCSIIEREWENDVGEIKAERQIWGQTDHPDRGRKWCVRKEGCGDVHPHFTSPSVSSALSNQSFYNTRTHTTRYYNLAHTHFSCPNIRYEI